MQAGEGEGKEGLPPPEGRARRMDAPPPAPAAGTTSGGPAAPGRAASRAAASEAAARRWGSWGYCHGCRKHVEVAAAAVPAEPGVSPSCPDCHRDFVELLDAPPATTRGGELGELLLLAQLGTAADRGGGVHPNFRREDYLVGRNDLLDEILAELAESHQPTSLPTCQDAINSLPRSRVGDGTRALYPAACSVCQEKFTEGQEAIHLACQHTYHESCLLPWLKTNSTCPSCRGSIQVSMDTRPSRASSYDGLADYDGGEALRFNPRGRRGAVEEAPGHMSEAAMVDFERSVNSAAQLADRVLEAALPFASRSHASSVEEGEGLGPGLGMMPAPDVPAPAAEQDQTAWRPERLAAERAVPGPTRRTGLYRRFLRPLARGGARLLIPVGFLVGTARIGASSVANLARGSSLPPTLLAVGGVVSNIFERRRRKRS